MKTIWIVYPYGDIVGEKFLEARHIRFGRIFAENGYRVIYWTANFSHTFKTKRSDGWERIHVCDGFDIELVPSGTYKKNISIGRVLFESRFAHHLSQGFEKYPAPDLILTAGTGLVTAFYPVWPYIKQNPVPTIYDIMDVHLFNSYMETNHKWLTPLARALTNDIEKREKPFYEHIDAVCGLGRNQVEIARERTEKSDIPTCLVYNSIVVEDFRKKMESPCMIELPEKEAGEIWCVYAGSLGPSYDIGTLIRCADRAREDKIRFIVAGAGPQEGSVAEASKENEKITYLGSIDPDWLPAIYKRCDIGLCPYASYSTVDMPDKFYDYTAAGLAVVNSLQGEIKEYVQDIGMQYEAGSSDSLYMSIKEVGGDLETYKSASYALAERFDLNNQMRPLLKLIDGLLEKKDGQN